ncbi:hypothetical protein PHYSODRAFT_445515, partial [Phytophthora sojae]
LSAGMKEELERIDFVWNASQYKWDHIVLPSLQRFYEVHRHSDIPRDFIVPTGDDSWPRS